MSALVWAGVVLIGGAGSVARFLADGVVSSAGRDFPLGTLAVNVSGAVLLGLIAGLALGRDQALLGAGHGDHGMPLRHKLMVYASEAQQYHGQPVHRAIIRRLRSAGIAGATTQRGIWGFHGDHAPHGDRLLQLGRHVPAATVVIDTPERIRAAFSVIDELTSERGLVTSETIPAIRRGGAAGPAGKVAG